ncbi:MAG: M20 family metallopeptidase [Candidatus Heimdallarchaeota archaeon]
MSVNVDAQFAKQTLVSLVKIPSENPPGSNLEIVEYLADVGEKERLAVRRQCVDKEKKMENIIIAPSEEAFKGRKIVLAGHLDTVPIGDLDNWTKDPFGKDQEGDILFGRGSCDMKSGVASFLSVIKAFKQLEPLAVNPIFIGTADEENLMRGVKKILCLPEFQTPPEFAVIGEPTGLQIGIAEKGISHVKVSAKGVAAHGARPDLGANAIDACYRIIQLIRKNMPKDTDPILGPPTMNLGTLQGGIKVNIVAEQCHAELDFRFGPNFETESMEKLVQKACMEIKDPYKVDYEVIHQLPALGTSPNHPFILSISNELKRLGHEPKVTGLTYATDGAVLVPEWKIPFLIFGPGDQETLHIADEWVSISETVTAAQVVCNAFLSTNP